VQARIAKASQHCHNRSSIDTKQQARARANAAVPTLGSNVGAQK
jgi:hypothetical protein